MTTYFRTNMQKLGPLELTVIEHFTDMNIVHLHCNRKLHINLIHPRLLPAYLINNSEVLKNRAHRLYYVVPPFGTIMSLHEAISFDVFFENFLRNVNNIYAVIVNHTTSDCKKVVDLYLNQVPPVYVNRTDLFKQTIARPFSHRPMEPEMDSSREDWFHNQRHHHNTNTHFCGRSSIATKYSSMSSQTNNTVNQNKHNNEKNRLKK